MRNLRGAENNLVRFAFDEINQTRIAASHLDRETDYLAQHLVQREFGADNATDSMKKRNLSGRGLHENCRSRHTKL
jgi:hypothetical protein